MWWHWHVWCTSAGNESWRFYRGENYWDLYRFCSASRMACTKLLIKKWLEWNGNVCESLWIRWIWGLPASWVLHCVCWSSTFRVNFSHLSSRVILSKKMGPILCPETSVSNYHPTLLNIPEEWRLHVIVFASVVVGITSHWLTKKYTELVTAF